MKTRGFAVCAVVFLFCGVSHADLSTGLMAHWSFDDCTTNDSSGNGNNGAKVGDPKCVAGISGMAMQFNGSTDYIKVPNSTSLNPVTQWTMSFWVKVIGMTNESSPLLHKGGTCVGTLCREYGVWLQDQNPYFQMRSAGDGSGQHALDSPRISKAEWIHYVGIIDRVNHIMMIYLNGKKVTETPDSYSSFNNNTHDLRIGWFEEIDSRNSPFQGILDDIRLYNRAISASEVQQLYQGQSTCPGEVVKFTAGTPAKAAEVNANFDTLNCQIQVLNSQVQALQGLKAIVCQDHPTASVCQ